MPTAVGFLASMGIGKESVYGTPVTVTQRLPLLSEAIDDNFDLILDLSLQGRGAPRQPDQGNQHLKGQVKTKMRYLLDNLWLEHWFGAVSGGHYTPTPSTEDTGLTLAFDKVLSVWEVAGVKVGKLVIVGKASGVEVDSTIIGTSLNRTPTANSREGIQALIDPTPNIMFPDFVFRIGPKASTLSDTDAIGVTEFTITMDRPLDETFTNLRRTPLQAGQTGYRMVELAFKIPRYDTDRFQDYKTGHTRLQADLIATSPDTGSSKHFRFPNLSIMTVSSPIAGPGIIGIDVKMKGTEGEDPDGRTFDIELFET